tara:strand:+ start:4078 stop:4962 length:885 start_codon:yes stop_codon:yes gene_type:complete
MSYSIIIHGGAGSSLREFITDEKDLKQIEKLYFDALKQIINFGKRLLQNNIPAIDVVERCCIKLENNELFNAGIGATRNKENKIFHDAIIVNGKTRDWGAISNCNIHKNPVKLAKHIMNKKNGLISGNENIKKYCDSYKITTVNSRYFNSKFRNKLDKLNNDLGTVGVVVRDKLGNICCATSTGGLTNKIPGRIGDTPMCGISSIASNQICGISVSGQGEEIIKNNVASKIFYQMKYTDKTLSECIDDTLENMPSNTCGIIGIDRSGDIYFNKNTKRMYIASADSKNNTNISLY